MGVEVRQRPVGCCPDCKLRGRAQPGRSGLLSDCGSGMGKVPKNSWRQLSPHYIWQRQKAVKGRRLRAGRGPPGVPRSAHRPGPREGGPGPSPEGVAQPWATGLLVFPAPPPVTGSPLPRAQEAGGRGPGELVRTAGCGRGWGAEGTEALSLPSPPLRPRAITLRLGKARAFPIRGN